MLYKCRSYARKNIQSMTAPLSYIDPSKHSMSIPTIQNYRPISVLPFISKIYKQIVENCPVDFLELPDLLYKYQVGFRKSHKIPRIPRILYYIFVYPYLTYFVEVWGNSCSTYLEHH